MSESIANIVELVGSSDKGWHEAVEVALEEATKTVPRNYRTRDCE